MGSEVTYISVSVKSQNFEKFFKALSLYMKKRREKVRPHKISIDSTANYQTSDDLYSLNRAFVLYADVNGFVTSLGAVVGYLCFRRHVWKAQQWLEYVSSASSSSARLSSGGRLFRANADLAFRNLTCFNPFGGRELTAVEETSLNHTHREHRHIFQ